MSIKKLILKGSVAAVALALAGTAAAAAVDLSAALGATPAKYATELLAANATVTNAANSLDLTGKIGWGVAAGNHLYVRVDLANGKFKTPLAAGNLTVSTAGSAVSLSSGGAAGTSFVIFDASAGPGAPILLTDTFTLAPTDLTLVDPNQPLTATVKFYTDSTLAATNGAALATLTGNYVIASPALTVTVTPAAPVADVAYAFKKWTNTTDTALMGQVAVAVNGVLKPSTGAAVVPADLATAADLTLTGAFGAVGATGNIFLDTLATCATGPGTNAVLNTAKTTATFTGYAGVTLVPAKAFVCFKTANATAVSAQTVSGTLAFTGKVAGATINDTTATVSSITRNGTTLQTPWFSTASGFLSRVFLTNTGATAANITSVTKILEAGNTCTDGTGMPTSIPANSMIEIPVSQICSSLSGNTRGAVVFTIEAPNTDIQGVYNVVNPTNATPVSYPLLRPGTN